MPGRSPRRLVPSLSTVGIVLAYAAVAVVMAGPYTNFAQLDTASYPGDLRAEAWILAWDNHALLNGKSLFDAPVYFPSPAGLAYDEHMFGLSLFTLPIFAATGKALLGYNLATLFSWFANAIAAYALARRHVRDKLAAFVGGLIYAFSFYRMLHGHSHVHLVWAFFIPLSLIALDRWLTRPTWPRVIVWTTAMLLQILTSWYLAIMVLIANGLYGLCIVTGLRLSRVRQNTRASEVETGDVNGAIQPARPSGRMVLQLAAAVIVIVVAVAPFTKPYATLPPITMGEPAKYSADATAFFYPPLNTWMGQLLNQHGDRRPRWLWGENTLYLGTIALAFTVVGMFAVSWKSSRRRTLANSSAAVAVFAVALGGAATALSMGPSPGCVAGNCGWSIYDLFVRLPFMTSFRAPTRFTELLLLSQVLLAAAGASWLHGRFGWKARAATLVLIPLMLSEWYVVGFPLGKPAPTPVPTVYSYLASLPPAPVVSLPTYRNDRNQWFVPADYLYYSTVHWRPMVNGFGRSEPKQYSSTLSSMSAFAGPNSLKTMRRIGVGYVVLHTARYPDKAVRELAEALGNPGFELVKRFDEDYLFRVRPTDDGVVFAALAGASTSSLPKNSVLPH